jgi:hypothetical protein
MKPNNRNTHTPGPWSVEDGTIVCFSNSEYELCRTEISADARLIAAAPELLEALSWCIAALNSRGIDSTTGELDRAKQILAKATGGAE